MHKKLGRKINVLDFGCGKGNAAAKLASALGRNAHVVGVSIEPIKNRSRKVDWNIKDTSQLERKFGRGSFDFIYSHYGGVYYAGKEGKQNETIGVIHNLLKPNGRAIFTAWQPNSSPRSYIDFGGFRKIEYSYRPGNIFYLEKIGKRMV